MVVVGWLWWWCWRDGGSGLAGWLWRGDCGGDVGEVMATGGGRVVQVDPRWWCNVLVVLLVIIIICPFSSIYIYI